MAEAEAKPKGEPVNSGEGADPSKDLRKQNPGQTTTQDLKEGKNGAARKGERK
jgi:hypothetical protein